MQMKREQHAAEHREFTVTAEGTVVCGHALIQDVQDNWRSLSKHTSMSV